jgi:hypothetical protein
MTATTAILTDARRRALEVMAAIHPRPARVSNATARTAGAGLVYWQSADSARRAGPRPSDRQRQPGAHGRRPHRLPLRRDRGAPVNRRLARLMAAVAEAGPRRRAIGASPAERQRFRRAEDRDLPTWPRKEDCPGCASTRDELGRLCIGFCGPECERRPA